MAACGGSSNELSQALEIVSRHTICYDAPPQRIPCPYATDAPLLGNGSMSVAIAGTPEKQVFYVCRNDFPSEQLLDRTDDGVLYLSHAFTEDVDIPTRAVMALRNLSGNKSEFELQPDVPVRLVIETAPHVSYRFEHAGTGVD